MMPSIWTRLGQRELIGERMDDPSLPEGEHLLALKGLRRINAISRTAPALCRALRGLLGHDRDKPRRVLDVACGDGDNAVQLARIARRYNLNWHISGCDISERSIDFAKAHAQANNLDLSFFQCDALGELDTQGYDAVVNTLFLHHLENEQITAFLRRLQNAQHVVIQDLVRGRRAYAATSAGVRVLSRSAVVHVDGPLSVRAALTPAELVGLSREAGMQDAAITRSWPMRQMLVWSRP